MLQRKRIYRRIRLSDTFPIGQGKMTQAHSTLNRLNHLQLQAQWDSRNKHPNLKLYREDIAYNSRLLLLDYTWQGRIDGIYSLEKVRSRMDIAGLYDHIIDLFLHSHTTNFTIIFLYLKGSAQDLVLDTKLEGCQLVWLIKMLLKM